MSQIDAQGHQNDELYKIRHSAEHVLTQAVEQLYPNQHSEKNYVSLIPLHPKVQILICVPAFQNYISF